MKKISQKKKTLGWLVVALVVFNIAVSTIGTIATVPTAAHRNVRSEISDITFVGPGDSQTDAEQKRLRVLSDSKENDYTMKAGMIEAVVGTIASVAVVVYLYRFIRKRRLVENAILGTILVDTIAMVIAMWPIFIIGEYIVPSHIDNLGGNTAAIFAVFGVVGSILLNILSTGLIAMITQWRYNLNHGFSD